MTASVAARLAELGCPLPAVAAPLASYVPAVRAGGLVWTSGQLPLRDGALVATGRVGLGQGLVAPDAAADAARVAVLNAIAAIAAVADLDQVIRIVKLVGYVASAPGFTAQPAVVNGASDLVLAVWGEAGRHARSAVGVAALPLDAPVEIELVAALS